MSHPASSSSTAHRHACLFELGCEELPVSFIESALTQWPERLTQALRDARLWSNDNPAQLQFYATPRRLAVKIQGLPATQNAERLLVKGPSLQAAFQADGTPSNAALGFCRKWHITPEQLSRTEENGQQYVAFEQDLPQAPLADVLPEVLTRAVTELQGPLFMRWLPAQPGLAELRFPRPIRWLVCLLDDTPLPFEFAGLQASNVTWAHRTLAPSKQVAIPHVDAYEEVLETQAFVIPCPDKRCQRIREEIARAAAQEQGTVAPRDIDELLGTLTHLVEWPKAVVGRFESAYLDLPAVVLATVLKSHQKCLPLRQQADTVGETTPLLPCFLTIANGVASDAARQIIEEGNARVVRARFQDALFFYQEDLATPLQDRFLSLRGITFQKGLGSVADKMSRLEQLARTVLAAGNADGVDANALTQAVRCLKADLTTHMVFEFTELEGQVGRDYALKQGLSPHIAEAIAEHYLPRFPGDALPQTDFGLFLGILDRVDTLTALFSQPNFKIPSGSRDPLGLRRMVAGLLQLNVLLLEKIHLAKETGEINPLIQVLDCSLSSLVEAAFLILCGQIDKTKLLSCEEVLDRLQLFYIPRLETFLVDNNFPRELAEAVSSSNLIKSHQWLGQLPPAGRFKLAVQALQQLKSETPASFEILRTAGERVRNILEKAPEAYRSDILSFYQVIATNLIENIEPNGDLERNVMEGLTSMKQLAYSCLKGQSYDPSMAKSLAQNLASPINALLDGAMIFDPDDAARRNVRLKLLVAADQWFMLAGDFRKVRSDASEPNVSLTAPALG